MPAAAPRLVFPAKSIFICIEYLPQIGKRENVGTIIHNRAAANVRNVFTKNGGNLGSSGSVSRMFDRKGVIEYDAEKVSEDEVMEAALDAGAEDIVNEDGIITVTTDPNSFTQVVEALEPKGWEALSAEVSMVPQMYTQVDADTAAKVKKLLDRLEEDDDVQNVWSTVEYPDDFNPED